MGVGTVKVLMVYTNTYREFAPAPLGARAIPKIEEASGGS